jgi:hypothetical protein
VGVEVGILVLGARRDGGGGRARGRERVGRRGVGLGGRILRGDERGEDGTMMLHPNLLPKGGAHSFVKEEPRLHQQCYYHIRTASQSPCHRKCRL